MSRNATDPAQAQRPAQLGDDIPDHTLQSMGLSGDSTLVENGYDLLAVDTFSNRRKDYNFQVIPTPL